jgi:hypothetical protein
VFSTSSVDNQAREAPPLLYDLRYPKEKAMNTRLGLPLAFIFLVAVVLAWGAWAMSEEKIPHYAFVIRHTDDGWEMKCEAGCAWKKLA